MRQYFAARWALGLLVASGAASGLSAQQAPDLRDSVASNTDAATDDLLINEVPVFQLPPDDAPPIAQPGQDNLTTSRTENDPLASPSIESQDQQEDTSLTGQAIQDNQLDEQTLASTQPATRQGRRRRELDPFAQLGLKAGAFLLFPSLQIGGIYTDNVEQSAGDRQDDFGLRLAPELRIQSDWIRHQFTFNAAGEFVFYKQNSDFDEQTLSANSNFRLDIRRTTTAQFITDYRLVETSSSDSEVPDTAVGRRQEHEFGFSAALTHTMNRLSATVTTGLRYLLFDDVDLSGGGTEDNADRNYFEPSVSLRLGYETSPAIQPFIEAGYQPRLHQRSVDRSGLRRDSHGGFVLAGIDLRLSPIWAGNIGVRYDVRAYDDATLQTVHGVGLDADLTWAPTALTSIIWTASSNIGESATSGVSGSRTHTGTVAVNHALRENLSIGSNASISYTDFISSSSEELSMSAGLSLSYLIRREIELLAAYEISGMQSTEPGADFIENQITAGFRFRM